MVVLETEEVGFKRTVMSASDYNVIVPIKKRKFPLIQSPPSSPPKELSSLPLDDNIVKVEEPGISDGLTVLNSGTITTSELSGKKEISFSEESEQKSDLCNANRVESNVEPSKVRLQEDDACFNGHAENKGTDTYVENEKHALHLLEKRELKLPPSDPNSDRGLCANEKSDEIDRKELEKCKSLTSPVKTEPELSVALNERLVPDLVVEGIDRKWQKPNNLELVSLNLSLRKQGSYTQCLTSSFGSDYDGSLMQSNRENWDLNTSMESWCPLKLSNEQCSGLQEGEESSVSDEEKINISADILEEDPYGFEYESDGKQDVAEAMDEVDNDIEEDYEDGEVREPIIKTQVESSICVKREVQNFDHGDRSNDKKINDVGLPGTDFSTLDSVKREDKLESHDVKREDNFHSVTTNQSSEQEKDEAFCLKELLVEENTANKVIKDTGRRQLLHCEKRDALEDQNIISDKATDGIEEPIVTVSKGDVENVKTVDFVRNNVVLPNVKEPVNNKDATNDFTHGSKHINLCHGSTSSSPSKTRSNLVRSVLTRTDREWIPAVALEGKKFQPQGRDDIYNGVSPKIYVNRQQNLSPQTNFTRRRGRFTIRTDSLQGEWDFNPTISPEIYSDQIPYDAPRRKYLSAVDDDIDQIQNHYKIKPDGPFRNAGRQGRQIIDDEGPPYCHMPSRRKSPGRRDGPPVRGVNMVRRMARNISPSSCIREAGSELAGPRHGEKLMRTFEDETMDPIYARPQPPYEIDRPPFIRERRNFSIQRKTFPRIDSKSPGRSRGRSPGQWFPGKRKSDRFCGHLEMTRRSSPGYRVDRMGSPDQPPPIHGDMPVRRHGFPFSPLPSNDLRDMGSAPDQGHMRSGIRSRNRTDRLSFRNRRFEVMDPRDRIESSEYFDGPVHSGQLNELPGDGGDDRRRFSDRHEHLHSFRPQYNDSDGENYHNNAEDSRRPFRFCAEDGPPEFHERDNLREREFDRHVKNQPGNLTRRTGVIIEEHEVEDYRHGRQMWNDNGFDDISRMKRKRF